MLVHRCIIYELRALELHAPPSFLNIPRSNSCVGCVLKLECLETPPPCPVSFRHGYKSIIPGFQDVLAPSIRNFFHTISRDASSYTCPLYPMYRLLARFEIFSTRESFPRFRRFQRFANTDFFNAKDWRHIFEYFRKEKDGEKEINPIKIASHLSHAVSAFLA